MMGFAAGPTGWVLAVLAMVVVWGGVWWTLSVLVFHWPASTRSAPPASEPPRLSGGPASAGWEQPLFSPSPASGAEDPSNPASSPIQPAESTSHQESTLR
mgnify:CR=1 FL=1